MILKNILNHLDSLSNKCGLNVPAELSHSTLKLTKQHIEGSTKGAVPLADFLSYRYFEESTNLFFNDDGVVGFIFEILPIVGTDAGLEKNLKEFFNSGLPYDSCLQFLLVGSHDIGEKINLWKSSRNSENEMLSRITEYREWFVRKMADDFSLCDGRMGKDFRIYISFSKRCHDNKKLLDETIDFQKMLHKKLGSLKLSPRPVNSDDLIYIVGDLLQIERRGRRRQKADPLNLLSNQILYALSKTKVLKDRIVHEKSDMVSKCFYPEQLPESFSLIEMIGLLGSSGESGIPARLVLSYSVSSVSKIESRGIIKEGEGRIHASERYYGRNDLNLKEDASEFRRVIARYNNGERFLSESMMVMISSPAGEIEIAEEALKTLYNSHDFQLKLCEDLQLPCMLFLLPTNQTALWQDMKYFKLTKLAQSTEIIAKLPIHGEWKGVSQSGVLFLGRRGELFNWNPFVRLNSGNYNVAVMAPSGSGKSVLLQELATSMLAQNTAVFVLDIGGSYQNICELLEGEILRFNQAGELNLNPFVSMIIERDQVEELKKQSPERNQENIEAEESIELLTIGNHYVTKDSIIYAKSIISAMCGIQVDARKVALIEKGISDGIAKYGKLLDITKLALILSDKAFENGSGYELAQTLFPYTEKGVHGRFFKTGKTASFKKAFTVFEFEEVKNDPILLSVLLQVILMQITQQFLVGDRSKQFVLIVDEAWMILSHSAAFLAGLGRTVRKYGGSLITCVQSFSDFQKDEDRKTILENSSWSIILKQDEKGIEAFKNSEAFKDYVPLIESVSLSTGKYAESLLCCTGLKIVGRLALDPYSQALYSTDQKDFRYLVQAKNDGISLHEAIKGLANKYGQLPELSSLKNANNI